MYSIDNHYQSSVLDHFYHPKDPLRAFTVNLHHHLQPQPPLVCIHGFPDISDKWNHTVMRFFFCFSLSIMFLGFIHVVACLSVLYLSIVSSFPVCVCNLSICVSIHRLIGTYITSSSRSFMNSTAVIIHGKSVGVYLHFFWVSTLETLFLISSVVGLRWGWTL